MRSWAYAPRWRTAAPADTLSSG